MAGLVFLFIITLMIFVLQYQTATASIQSSDRTRQYLLEMLRDSLEAEGLRVEVDESNGVLRLTEQSINFPSGSDEPTEGHESRIRTLARVMDKVIPCFVPERPRCASPPPEQYSATIDALLIEGHTDTQLLGQEHRLRDNLELSGARAATVHRTLVEEAPLLDSLVSAEDVRLLSISGYGARRLLDAECDTCEVNRRIDLRFIMAPPRPPGVGTTSVVEPAERVREQYEG
jgi:flagellar motor protein MotB